MQDAEAEATQEIRLVILQPTPFCNINCSYCYLPDRSNKARMSFATVEKIRDFLEPLPKQKEPLTICWHGGEPLTVGIDFYENALRILHPEVFACRVRHNFQTNGMLVTDEWCDFIKKNNIALGVSIDGPKHVHDSRRITRSHRGTFDSTVAGLNKLRKHGIPFATISVITPQSLDHAEEVISFLFSLKPVQVGFNIEEQEGIHTQSQMFSGDFTGRVSDFYRSLAKHQESWPEKIHVRELDGMRNHFQAPVGCSTTRSTNGAGSILNFDVDGNVSTFSPELLSINSLRYGKFSWTNVHSGSWTALISNERYKKVVSDINAGISLCRETCGYFDLCGGGDPSNKLAEHQRLDVAATRACHLHVKCLANVIIEEFETKLQCSKS